MTMKVISIFLAAISATLFLLAGSAALAVLPVAGTMSVAESTFAGNHRLAIAAAIIVLAALARLARLRAWPLAFAALAVGWLANLCYSAWLWRAEKLEMLADLGSASAAQLIQWRSGLYLLGGGIAFALAFLFWEIYLETRKSETD